jgi:hypothetical protein
VSISTTDQYGALCVAGKIPINHYLAEFVNLSATVSHVFFCLCWRAVISAGQTGYGNNALTRSSFVGNIVPIHPQGNNSLGKMQKES